MKVKLTKLLIAAGALAFTAFAGEAWALEGNSPFLPGVTVGTPIGALPPPGFYASDDNVIASGPLKNASGNSLPANVNAYVNIASVLIVPTYQPFQFLGATYAALLVDEYVQQSFGGTLGLTPTAAGFFNPIISPLNLSWNFQPFFIKFGFDVYLPVGDYTGGIANNTTTFEPELAITYLKDGWNFTANALLDFQTSDNRARVAIAPFVAPFLGLPPGTSQVPATYQSGNLFTIDLTAAKSIGKWTFGVGGNYTQQLNNDRISNTLGCAAFGVPGRSCDLPAIPGVRGKGNVTEKTLAGPLVGYNFGPVELDFKALFGVQAQNTFNTDFYHISFAFPF